jgi:hypothetical protein
LRAAKSFLLIAQSGLQRVDAGSDVMSRTITRHEWFSVKPALKHELHSSALDKSSSFVAHSSAETMFYDDVWGKKGFAIHSLSPAPTVIDLNEVSPSFHGVLSIRIICP